MVQVYLILGSIPKHNTFIKSRKKKEIYHG
nr:MAG TPA: hypothetical protein [Caudoviricetes sp.]